MCQETHLPLLIILSLLKMCHPHSHPLCPFDHPALREQLGLPSPLDAHLTLINMKRPSWGPDSQFLVSYILKARGSDGNKGLGLRSLPCQTWHPLASSHGSVECEGLPCRSVLQGTLAFALFSLCDLNQITYPPWPRFPPL